MSAKRCCVPNCNKIRGNGNILHLFPNPDKNLDRFLVWTKAVGGEILSLDEQTVFRCRRICHCHFEPQYETRSNRLSPAAVPTLYLQGDASDTAVDFPLQEYSHPLCTENQDEFPISVISTGDNDFTVTEYDGTDNKSQSLKQSMFTNNKRKYLPERSIYQNKETTQNDYGAKNIQKRNKGEETCENVTDNDEECIHCVFDKDLDKRNDYFGNLLKGELQLLPPCMRSHAYINILKYVEKLKHKHLNINENLQHNH